MVLRSIIQAHTEDQNCRNDGRQTDKIRVMPGKHWFAATSGGRVSRCADGACRGGGGGGWLGASEVVAPTVVMTSACNDHDGDQ